MGLRGSVRRAWPGAVEAAGWLAVIAALPQVHFSLTHRWEEDQRVLTALYWTAAAVPALAAIVAARHARAAGRPGRSFPAAVTVATCAGMVLLGVSLAVYRWIIPLDGTLAPLSVGFVVAGGLSLALTGAVVGYLFALCLPPSDEARTRNRPGYLRGVGVAALGALLMQITVQVGADDSTRSEGSGSLPVPDLPAGVPVAADLPTAGRYGVYAQGESSERPDCRVSGPGFDDRSARPVANPSGPYGGDAASYTWVAYVDVPAPGTYAVACRTPDGQGTYRIGAAPTIAGAVGAVVHWPPILIWLLGALPGLLAVADTVRRRRAGTAEHRSGHHRHDGTSEVGAAP